jgi:replicative DNA helicase
MNRIIGGFGAGELHVIGGGTGQGKSLLTQSIALNMALSGIPVLLFTLEMLPKENTIRLLSMIKSRCNQDLLGELPLSYFHGDAVSLEILEKTVKKGVQDGVKVVIIDHLHFFARAVENQSSEIGNITRFIKLLARRYGVAIILVSHIRKINNAIAEPGLDDLRDSSFIAQDADSVMMVWRDMRNPNSDEFRKLKVYVKKNRRKGTLGNLMYYCDENYYLKEMNYECGSSY